MKNLFSTKTRWLVTILLLITFAVPYDAWGAIYSLTPNQASTGSSSTSYITSLTEFSYTSGSAITWKMNQWNPSNLQVKANQSSASNEFRFYNNSAFAGKITKVVITLRTVGTVSETSGFMFLGGTSAQTATTSGASGTWNATAKTITWTPASNTSYTYFAFYQNGKVMSGNNYLANSDAIVVTYLTAVTLDKNGGSANGAVKFDHNATEYATSSFTAVTRSNYTCTGYWTAASGGTKVLNADGSFAGTSVSESSTTYISSSKWVYAPGTLTLYAQWESAAPVSPAKAVYLKPNGIWNKDGARFAIYYWKSSDGDANGWLDMSTYCGPNYTVTVPEGYDKFQFCRMDGSTATNNWDNVWNRTPDLDKPTTNDVYTIEYMDGDAYHNSTGSWGTYTCPDPTTIYLNPNGIWDVAGARYAAYYWEGDDTHWVDFEAACGAVTAEIPSGYTNIILCRMNGATATNNWSNCWNQTTDQVTTGHDNYVFTISSINGCTDGKSCGAWTAYVTPTYTISYAKGSTTYTGGNTIDGSRSNETKTCGTDFTLPSSAVFSATGYTQTGWSTSDDGTQDYALGGSYQTNAAQTFYPFWTVNSHTLTWDFDGGSSSETAGTDYTAGGSVNYGTTIDYPSNASMSKTGYTFTGWSSSPATMPDANLTITAQWAEESDTYIDNIWNTATQTKTGTYTRPTIEDQAPGGLTDCQHLHYHFAGWVEETYKDSPSGHILSGGSVTADGSTYYAVWEKAGSGGGTEGWYEKAIGDLTSDDIFVLSDGSYAIENYNQTGEGPNMAEITVVDATVDYISSTVTDNIKWNIRGNATNGYIFLPNGDNTNYLYCNTVASSKSNDCIRVGTGYRHFWKLDNDGYLISDSTNIVTRYLSNYNNQDCRGYVNTNTGPIAPKCYAYDPGVTYEDPIATCGEEYTITINKNESSATCTSCGAKVNANATALSNLVAPTWAGHQVDYYMVASADNSTKIAEVDGTLASNVTVSGTPWTDANGKWVKADDATFYAKWKATECVITLNNEGADSGHEGTASVTATYGANTNLTTSINTPTKNGYDFGGYFTEAGGAGTQLINADGSWKASVTGYTNASKQWQLDATALELHAQWTLKSYTVTWVVNGETEATQTSVSYGTAYSALTEEPDVADNALSDCGSDKFVGWVTQEYTAEGGTAATQYDPYKVSASTLIDDNHHTFYAMFATENGTAFTLDGEVGSTQDVHVYYTDGTNNYYATGNIGATSNGKIDSSTDVADANTYVFTKTGTGTYTIQKKNDANYIKYASSTDLGTQAAAYTWTISDVSSAGLGSWRLQSATNGRAWICATTGTPKFGGYSTGNVTSSQPYRDVELGSSNLTNYRTGCCSEKIILAVSDATSGAGGTVALQWNNADKSAGDQVSTCSAGTLVAKVTANPGYILTAIAISGTDKTITTTPADLTTGLPSTEEMTYSVAVQALATGTLTITPTFSRTYSVTYDLAGGETSGSTATVRYQSGEQVTLVTPDPTKSGYNFSEWNVTKEGGGNVTVSNGKFTMPTDNVTVTATWTEKTLTSISLGSASVEVYVGQYVEIPVTYDPADILTKNYTLVANPSYCVTTGSTITILKITGGRGGVTLTENKTETVSIKANADDTKTASVSVTVKPLPVDHYVDLIHGVSFDDKGSTIVNNELSATYTAPGYGDYSGSTTGDCETNHLHLVGWIDSEWADAHPKASHAEIIAAEGYHTAREAGMTASNKTYYAVWGDEQ